MLVLLAALATGALAGAMSVPHCVGMCGPYAGFACASGPTDTAGRGLARLPRYLAGRTLAYVGLGAAAGGSGGLVEVVLPASWSAVALAAALALGMLSLAYRLASPTGAAPLVRLGRKPGPTPRPEKAPPSAASRRVARIAGLVQAAWTSPALLGALMALFPCGALYAALLVAGATASPWTGASSMLGFALSSGTALGVSGWIARASIALDRPTRLALSAALVMGAVVLVARPILGVTLAGETPACPHPSSEARP